ncbi:MAG TPA: 3-oxoacyl-ACP reductase [Planctomycetaceae bacterium]|nr:3-oxoacyl-ACP reductase [Planctomycetaceae bacterium]HAA49805.1 3-oxoacyl-ACP reductase [Planctomycetaceae bacterium]HCK53057.1 3-oxoacyl-ACP reductase [Planctomycetaceae bacterium]|tara:strand:- start:1765 stop:2535 length:771 start_codon:yes stop_codon:yes gene_type:complete
MNETLFDLTGRVALVTGGSKGLGLAMARGYAEAGADVVISSRHQDELDAALVQITDGLSVKGLAVVADMTKREDVKRLAETALAEMGRVDVLVNNAGSNVPEEIDAITDENWDRIIELNLTSCMALTRELVPQMTERGWGRVIHISSIMGLVSKEGRNAYSATKSGLLGLTRASALDLGGSGVTVNAICPGPFLTDLPQSVLSEEQIAFFAERTALGRWGECRELVGTALLLGTDAGSYITGTSITVDGGTVVKSF